MITQEPNEQSTEFVKAYAGANQQLIGRVAGDMMLKAREAARKEGVKLHSKEGNLLVFQHPEGEKTGVERWKGFEEATKGEPFNVLGTEYGANDPETGYEKGNQVIPRFKGKGIDFLYVSNQQAANGIIRALKENGIKPGKDVKIVSSDCSGSLEAVKNGETFGTGLQSGAIEGSLGVATAARYIATKKVEGDVQQFKADARAARVRGDAAGEAELHAARGRHRGEGHRHADLGLHGRGDLRGRVGPPSKDDNARRRGASSAAPPRCAHVTNPPAAPTDTSRLTVRGLSKRYGSVQALDRVDFDLRPGEIMALLGENGAGKSTLVKVLAGLVDPDEGTIEIDGAPGDPVPERPARRRPAWRSCIRSTARCRR